MSRLSLLSVLVVLSAVAAVASARYRYRNYYWRGYDRCSAAKKARAYGEVEDCVNSWTSRYTRNMWSCSVVEEVLDCYRPLRICGDSYAECEAWEELKYLGRTRSGVTSCRAYESYRMSMKTYGCPNP